MSKSLLNRRIDICNSISKLNNGCCFDIIRLLGNAEHMKSADVIQWTTKMFMDYSNNWAIDQMMQFEKEIKETISNHNHERINQLQTKTHN